MGKPAALNDGYDPANGPGTEYCIAVNACFS